MFLIVLIMIDLTLFLASSNAIQTISFNAPDSPYELPWSATTYTILSGENRSLYTADLNGDGLLECVEIIRDYTPEAIRKSQVIIKPSIFAAASEWQQEYRGDKKYAWIAACQFMDLLNGPGQEMILTKCFHDTVYLEIVSFDSTSHTDDILFLRVAVASGLNPGSYVELLVSTCLASIDINADGRRDLVYNLIAKPDSSIQRGIYAFDLYNKELIWLFPTADQIGLPEFYIYRNHNTEPIFVFTTISNSNAYESNCLTSAESGQIKGGN